MGLFVINYEVVTQGKGCHFAPGFLLVARGVRGSDWAPEDGDSEIRNGAWLLPRARFPLRERCAHVNGEVCPGDPH